MDTANLLVKAIKKSIDNRQFNVEVKNFGKAIEIIGRGQAIDSGFWIRLERYKDKLAFNINSVYLNERMRGRGILTKLCFEVINSGLIDELWVSSVSTSQMHDWCKKKNMVYDENSMTYKYIVREDK